jgi:hypothetical protein
MKFTARSLASATAAPAFAQQSTASLPPPVLVDPKVAALRDNALENDHWQDITEGLTTEVGQRLAATEADARARQWAVTADSDGLFERPHRAFTMPVWTRGAKRRDHLSFPQKLASPR